jgi:hypothetical protein
MLRPKYGLVFEAQNLRVMRPDQNTICRRESKRGRINGTGSVMFPPKFEPPWPGTLICAEGRYVNG